MITSNPKLDYLLQNKSFSSRKIEKPHSTLLFSSITLQLHHNIKSDLKIKYQMKTSHTWNVGKQINNFFNHSITYTNID